MRASGFLEKQLQEINSMEADVDDVQYSLHTCHCNGSVVTEPQQESTTRYANHTTHVHSIFQRKQFEGNCPKAKHASNSFFESPENVFPLFLHNHRH